VFVDAGNTCTSTELRDAGRSARSCTAVVPTATVPVSIVQNIILKLGIKSILIFVVLQNYLNFSFE